MELAPLGSLGLLAAKRDLILVSVSDYIA